MQWWHSLDFHRLSFAMLQHITCNKPFASGSPSIAAHVRHTQSTANHTIYTTQLPCHCYCRSTPRAKPIRYIQFNYPRLVILRIEVSLNEKLSDSMRIGLKVDLYKQRLERHCISHLFIDIYITKRSMFLLWLRERAMAQVLAQQSDQNQRQSRSSLLIDVSDLFIFDSSRPLFREIQLF